MRRPKKPRRPAPVEYRAIRARAARGPRAGLWYWTVQHQREGTRHTAGLGWLTRAGAEDALSALVRSGWPDVAEVEPRVAPTVRALLELYLEHQEARVAAGQIAAGTLLTNTWSAKALGELLDADLATIDGASILSWIGRAGLAPGTLRNALGVLGAGWRWGMAAGHLSRPLEVPRVEYEPAPEYVPTPGEVVQVLAEIRRDRPYVTNQQGDAAALAVETIALTGARPGEVVGLTWDRVDLDRGVWTLRGKTGSRTIAIPEELQERLRALQASGAEEPYPVGRATPRVVARAACVRLGLRPWTLKALRKLAVNRMLRAGHRPEVVAETTGHSIAVMMRYYRRVQAEEIAGALTALRLPAGEIVEGPWEGSGGE